MTHLIEKLPIETGAAAVFDYSEELERYLTRRDKFDKVYRLCSRRGNHLLVPRNLCPIGEDIRAKGDIFKFKVSVTPRNKDQEELMANSVSLAAEGESYIIQASTGFGKTVIGLNLVGKLRRKALIIVTKEDSKEEWISSAKTFLNLQDDQIGLIQGDTFDIENKAIVVAMIQTFSKNKKKFWEQRGKLRAFGVCLIDETHRLAADQFQQAMWNVPALIRVGLTATPYRSDGREALLQAHIGRIAIRKQFLFQPPKVIIVNTGWKVPRTIVNGNYAPIPHKHGRTTLVDKAMAHSIERNRVIVDMIIKSYNRNRYIVCFASMRVHLKNIENMLLQHKITKKDIGYYVGGLTKAEKQKVIEKPIILATYRMTAEATNVPWWDTGILCTPISNVEQTAGRILRQMEGKKTPVLFDLVDEGSNVLKDYFTKRRNFYTKIKAKQEVINGF